MDMTKHTPLLVRIADVAERKLEEEHNMWCALQLLSIVDPSYDNALIEYGRRVDAAMRDVIAACTNLDRSWENWHRYYNEVNMA